jgi:hypothetical protein
MALKAVSAPLGSPVGGSGTPGTIPVWSGSGTTLTDSIITQSGSTVAIGLLRFAGNVLSTSSAELAIQYATSRDTTVYAPGSSIALFVKGTTGSVGIGTASPQEKAQVSGNLKVGVTASDSFITFGDEGTTSRFNGIYRPASSNTMAIGSYNLITFNVSAANLGSQTERMRINSAGAAADSQVAIGTSSFTSGRALTTVQDIDIYGVRVGRGAGAVSSNTVVGSGVLAAGTTGALNTVLGAFALQEVSTQNNNTAIGCQSAQRMRSADNVGIGVNALRGSATAANNTGAFNVAVGNDSLSATTSGANNVAIGRQAGDSITTGSSNIVIGSGADTAAATTSNSLVLGDATNYVATNGGATTYYATAGASLGYIQVRLNGADVKIQVFAP